MANYNGCVRSETMQMNTWVQVITPDGTKKGDPPYKVIYMLHGTTGNSMDWVRYTRLPLYSCEYDVVFVIPEIANTWCRNIPDRGNFYNYIVDELPDLIGGMFNISDRREDVAIMGNSSGAYSAMKCALSRPEQFGLCAGFSTAGVQMDDYLNLLRLQKPEDMENPHMKSVFGPNLDYTDEDVLLKLATRASSNRQKPKIYMSIGKQDFLYDANEAFRQEMEQLSFDYTYEAWDGGHDWYFWDQSLKRGLQKYYQKHQQV